LADHVTRAETDGAGSDPPAVAATPTAVAPTEVRVVERGRSRLVASKILHFAVALFLFVLAIELMKSGAKAVNANIKGSFPFDNGISTLGFGWMSAYFVLSGSPVAAVALNLFHGGTLTPLQTFTMLSGSRLGASFIVLLTGFLYTVRNRNQNRGESIGMGVLALSLTALVYVPGMMIGYGILKAGWLDRVQWQASDDVLSLIDVVWGPIKGFVTGLVPGYQASAADHPELWILLPVGLVIILVSFKFLDRVLPELDGERHADKGHWLKKPWPMFFLGCLAATLTLSVSVALTVLVPLASKGYVKRDEAIPYIMGANITTLADTLVAAMVLGNRVGVQIVLAQAIAVALVTVFYLAFLYRPINNGVLALDDWVVGTNRRLWLFTVTLFVLPILFLTSGLYIGPITR
jgi:hypothetical protein